MSLHNQIMNLPCSVTKDHFADEVDFMCYKEGHKDARHAAAELSIPYEVRIEKLESALRKIADTRVGGCLCTMRESCSVCDSFSPVNKLCEIAKEALK